MPTKSNLSLLIVFALIHILQAGNETILLQNGTDGYDGCKDSYTHSITSDTNFGDSKDFHIYNCPT